MGAQPLIVSLYAQGVAVSGAKVYSYVKDTTTAQAIYTDSGLTTPAANPSVSDSEGRVALYLNDALSYSIVIKAADDSYTFFAADYEAGANGFAVIQTEPISAEDQADIATVAGAIDDGTIAALVDPATYLLKANNLSDIASASTARSNLGLGDMAVANYADAQVFGAAITAVSGTFNTAAAVGQVIDLAADRLGDANAYGLGFYTGGYITYLAGTAGHQWYIGKQADGSPEMELTTTGLSIPGAYSTTTASAANINVNTSGLLRRSTSAAKYKIVREDIAPERIDRFFDICAQNDTLIWYRSDPDKTDDPREHSYYGMIADRFVEDFPQLCHFSAALEETADPKTGEVTKKPIPVEVEGFAYERTAPFLIARILELTARIEALEGANQ